MWGNFLFHKVGTGKTITSLLIAFNSLTEEELYDKNLKIYIVAPTSVIFGNFKDDLQKFEKWNLFTEKLVDYNYDRLIHDINRKNIRHNFADSIIIFDEAHRLVIKSLNNSIESGNVEKHPIAEDIFFKHKIQVAKKCIIMTGTPVQIEISDICKLLNFISRTDNFTVEKYAPVNFKSLGKQWLATSAISLLKRPEVSKFLLSGTVYLGKKTGASQLVPNILKSGYKAGLSALVPTAISYFSPTLYGSIMNTENSDFIFSLINYALLTSIFVSSYYILNKKQKKYKGGTRRSIQKRRRTQKLVGGDPNNEGNPFNILKTINPVDLVIGVSDPIKQIFLESKISSFQEKIEELYTNDWNLSALAKDASPYISIFDPDIQEKLVVNQNKMRTRGQQYNIDSLKEMQNFNSLKNASSKLLEMPKKLYHEEYLTYDDKQMDMIRELFTNEMNYKFKKVLNLNLYESKTPDIKTKYKFIRNYARMIGNFSEDIMNYYAVINKDGTDYDVYERESGLKVDDLSIFKSKGGLFHCRKFEKCKKQLLQMRTTGQMIDPEMKRTVNQPEIGQKKIKEILSSLLTKQPTKEEIDSAALEKEYSTIPQAHMDGSKQYLPLVYSYTEDYGLALFCVYLKSLGFNYLLTHINQEKSKFKENVDKGIKNTFEPINHDNYEKEPLCILIHPTMTEGYDFKFNPAIFLLEPCNTFGDQEQVQGRVLRSYNLKDIETFGGERKKKLIVQYVCGTPKDIWFIGNIKEKLNLLLLKFNVESIRTIYTPLHLVQMYTKAQIESPDYFGMKKIQGEEMKLNEFKKLIEGGVDFSDLFFLRQCLNDTSKNINLFGSNNFTQKKRNNKETTQEIQERLLQNVKNTKVKAQMAMLLKMAKQRINAKENPPTGEGNVTKEWE